MLFLSPLYHNHNVILLIEYYNSRMKYLAYKYRIYPNKNQALQIQQHIDACRFVYNWGLALRITTYQTTNKSLSCHNTSAELTKLKHQDGYSWLKQVNAQSLQTSLKNLDKAYTNFFRNHKGFPIFKSKKKAKQSFSIPQEIYVEKDKLFIPKIKTGIKIVIDRPIVGKIYGATITKTRSNKYYIAIKVEQQIELPLLSFPTFDKALGIDLGLINFITTSNGLKVSSPKYLNKSLRQLKKLQRQLSKKQKGSKNSEKARLKVALLYEKITNQRADFLHKLTTQLVNDNQADTYCVEDLNIKGMLTNHKLAKSINDASWAEFIRLLTYKAEWKGKNILYIGRFEPSSKMCGCGVINRQLSLSDREWYCNNCGIMNNRDILAATNIKHFAFNKQNLIGITTNNQYSSIGSDRSKYMPVENKKVLFDETGSF